MTYKHGKKKFLRSHLILILNFDSVSKMIYRPVISTNLVYQSIYSFELCVEFDLPTGGLARTHVIPHFHGNISQISRVSNWKYIDDETICTCMAYVCVCVLKWSENMNNGIFPLWYNFAESSSSVAFFLCMTAYLHTKKTWFIIIFLCTCSIMNALEWHIFCKHIFSAEHSC